MNRPNRFVHQCFIFHMARLNLLEQVNDMFLQIGIVRAASQNPIFTRDDIKPTQPQRNMMSNNRYGSLQFGLPALKWHVYIKTSPLFKVA